MPESLCESCAHRREVVSGKGSRFLLCLLSGSDRRFPKYPPQPVVRCSGYQSQSPSTSTSGDYVLRGGDQGARRLKLLARVMWPTTRRLLRRIGVRPGMSCLDAGCGIGEVTRRLARRVGPTGQVVGIDRDVRCIELARQAAARHNLPAIFRVETVGELADHGLYDLVYSRFLLSHLPDAGHALARLVEAVRPGGRLVVEDVEFAAHFCYPPCPAFDRYVSLYEDLVHQKGADANIGPRLVQMLMDAGLEEVDVQVVQPTFLRGPGKLMAPVTMEHIREAAVQAGLTSPSEVDALVAELDRFAGDPRTFLSVPRIFQVWGRRPSGPGSIRHAPG